ncbi:MAG: hypothetical protein GEU96_06350 [Propionibacteriales bacterium]|nr:hypothetical protein [Propionibacteriales bacterium]
MMSRVRLVVVAALVGLFGSLLVAVPASGVSDAPHYCSAARRLSYGVWQSNTLQYRSDVDWYSFRLTDTRRVRAVLGDLPSNFRLSLYGACGDDPLVVSQRGGTTFEEIWKKLPAGTYRLRVGRQPMAATSSRSYRIRFVSYRAGVHAVSSRWLEKGTWDGRIVGDLINNTSWTRFDPKVRITFYNRSGAVVGKATAEQPYPWLTVGNRAPFIWRGRGPTSAVRYSLTVLSGSEYRERGQLRWLRVHGVQRLAAGPSVAFRGKVTNDNTDSVSGGTIALIAYDPRGFVRDASYARSDGGSIGPRKSATWTAYLRSPARDLHLVRYQAQGFH